MAAVTICNDFGGQENKASHGFHCFPTYKEGNENALYDTIMMGTSLPTFDQKQNMQD